MSTPRGQSDHGIDAATVRRVAHLARLGLDEAELKRSAEQLDVILQHFHALQAVDTTGVEPMEHALGDGGVPGADIVDPFAQPRTTLLPLTEHAREGFFVVPAVLDTDFGEDRRTGALCTGAPPTGAPPTGVHTSPTTPGGRGMPDVDDDPGADA